MLFRLIVLFSILIIALFQSSPAYAFGKKKPNTNQVFYSTPKPVRLVTLDQIGTTPFHVPNGQHEPTSLNDNGGIDLVRLMHDATVDTGVFQIETSGAGKPCSKFLLLRSGISVLELNIAEIGLTIGYKGTVDSNQLALAGIEGSVNVKIGKLLMNFSVADCSDTNCQTIVTSEAGVTLSGTDAQFMFDFSLGQVGPRLVVEPRFQNAIKKAMENGMKKLALSTLFDRLPWFAKIVRDYDPQVPGLVWFDAGDSHNIALNQAFEVYSVTPSESLCSASIVIAHGHTAVVNNSSSVVQIDKAFFDPTAIKAGDIVKINIGGYTATPSNTGGACPK